PAKLVLKFPGRIVFKIARDATQGVGNQRDVCAGLRGRFISGKRARMSKRGRWKLSWNWCPTRLLRCLQVQPAEVYTPVGDTLLVSNGLKGNGHFKDIPVVIALHLRAPLVVPTEVYLRAFVHDTIPLGAGCVGAKGESVGLIVKRVNEHK